MALVRCPDCDHEVSDTAFACPSCGRPLSAGGFVSSRGFTRPASDDPAWSPGGADDPISVTPRPWVRYGARMFDVLLAGIAAAFVAAVYSPEILNDTDSDFVLTFWALVGWIPIESFFVSRFGTTPGKALLRTRVRRADGRLPEYGTALERSARVWFFGLGIGFPIVTAITMLVAHSKLTKHGRTTWDRRLDLVVEHREVGAFRTVVLLLSFLLIVALMVAGSA